MIMTLGHRPVHCSAYSAPTRYVYMIQELDALELVFFTNNADTTIVNAVVLDSDGGLLQGEAQGSDLTT